MYEWMRLAVSLAGYVMAARFEFIDYQNISICEPPRHIMVFDNEGVLERLAIDPELRLHRDNNRHYEIPYWEEYGMALIKVENLPNNECFSWLVVDCLLLMAHLEESFQTAIKRASGFAGSASERFHFDSRRVKKNPIKEENAEGLRRLGKGQR